MFYVENTCEVNQTQQQFIDFVLSDAFPWFYQNATTDSYKVYCHLLMRRDPNNEDKTGSVESLVYANAIDLFNSFCLKNDVKYNKILRAAFNTSHYDPDEHVDIHVDHSFHHYNFIMYLNEFTDGYTYIHDDDNNIVKKIVPSVNKAVVFSGDKHSHSFCSPKERRVILVITFN